MMSWMGDLRQTDAVLEASGQRGKARRELELELAEEKKMSCLEANSHLRTKMRKARDGDGGGMQLKVDLGPGYLGTMVPVRSLPGPLPGMSWKYSWYCSTMVASTGVRSTGGQEQSRGPGSSTSKWLRRTTKKASAK